MFCRNCGKDIGDANFCQYCGCCNKNPNIAVNLFQSDLFKTIKDKIKQIGHNNLIKIVAVISAIIGVIIRVSNNEIEVVYSFLAQDDYFVISESGRTFMIILIALQVIITLFLFSNAKKEQIKSSGGTIALSIISLLIQILAMTLRFPAPY